MQPQGRRFSRVFLATFLFCWFAAVLLHRAKVGSLPFVLVVGDVGAATRLLRFAVVFSTCLVWFLVGGKDRAALLCSGGGFDHWLGFPIHWVWDPGIVSARKRTVYWRSSGVMVVVDFLPPATSSPIQF